MNRILIGCFSGWQFPQRRLRCQKTWLADLHCGRYDLPDPAPPMPVLDGVLLLGTLQAVRPERYGDYLFLPVPNPYQFLIQRTRAFCQWALEQQWWDYLLKTDDDTRLHLGRLLHYDTKGADYIGAEWMPGVGYASGNGYLLSRKAATVVAETMTQWEGSEDVGVGKVMRKAEIPLRIDNEHFRVLMGDDDRPDETNDWVYASPKNREPE